MATTTNPNDPNYDPRRDPNSPQYDPNYTGDPGAGTTTPTVPSDNIPGVGAPPGTPGLPSGPGDIGTGDPNAPPKPPDQLGQPAPPPTYSAAKPQYTGPPTYDPAHPETFINYYYNQEYGTNAPPDQIAYWTAKLNSNEQTGTWDPTTNSWKIADPAYWATRILRQGYDDLNPPSAFGITPPTPTTPTSGGALAPAESTGDPNAWMNGPPPAPGWIAVPGVGWVPPDNPAAIAYQQQQSAAAPATATDPNNSPASIDDQMRTAIMTLLQTPPVDANSLQNDPSVVGYRLSSTRAADLARAQAVESAITGGTYGSGALDTQKAGIDQQRAEGEAEFVGTIAEQKMQDQRAAVVQGIQFAMAMGQFDKAQALQLKLAQIDAALRQAQIDQSGQLGNRSLDLQQLQIDNQVQQFLDSLGFDYTQLGVNANNAAAQALINSGGG